MSIAVLPEDLCCQVYTRHSASRPIGTLVDSEISCLYIRDTNFRIVFSFLNAVPLAKNNITDLPVCVRLLFKFVPNRDERTIDKCFWNNSKVTRKLYSNIRNKYIVCLFETWFLYEKGNIMTRHVRSALGYLRLEAEGSLHTFQGHKLLPKRCKHWRAESI
jgi:hypothetical protein